MPPEPTSSSSSYRPPMTSPTTGEESSQSSSCLRQDLLERLFPHAERFLELGVGEDERSEHANAVRVDPGLEEQEPPARRRLGNRGRELGRRVLRLAVVDELDREHHPEPAHVADRVESLLPAQHPRPHRLAE